MADISDILDILKEVAEEKVAEAVEEFNFDQKIEKEAESFFDSYDFETPIQDAVSEFNFDKEIKMACEEYDFDSHIKDAVEGYDLTDFVAYVMSEANIPVAVENAINRKLPVLFEKFLEERSLRTKVKRTYGNVKAKLAETCTSAKAWFKSRFSFR